MKVGPLELKENSCVWQVPRIPLAKENICSRGQRKASFILISWAAGSHSYPLCCSLSLSEAFESSPSCLPVPTVVLFHQKIMPQPPSSVQELKSLWNRCSLSAQPVISIRENTQLICLKVRSRQCDLDWCEMGFAQRCSAPWQSRARSLFKDFLCPCPLLGYCNNGALKRRTNKGKEREKWREKKKGKKGGKERRHQHERLRAESKLKQLCYCPGQRGRLKVGWGLGSEQPKELI